jgi:hypothetical protein
VPRVAPARYGSLPFAEAVQFLATKTFLGIEHWDDIAGQAHDQAFTVAGAMSADLLGDLHAAVLDYVEEGSTLETFRNEAGRAWRARVIAQTNLRTSYAAGRLSQQRAVTARRPWWRYRHSAGVIDPRQEHLDWDGLVLHSDDPWWATHYPPSGFGCRCYVETLSGDELDRRGLAPDQAPTPPGDRRGIDPGWDHQPGATRDLLAEARAKGVPEEVVQDLGRDLAAGAGPAPEQWPILEGDAATLDELKRLGDERLAELLSFTVPDSDDVAVPAFRGRRLDDLIRDSFNGGDIALPFAKRKMLEDLRKARSVGGERLATTNKSGKGRALADRVGGKLPTSWARKVNEAGDPYRVTVVERGRGWHNDMKWNERAAKMERRIQTDSGSTAEHEWTHAVQSAIPGLDRIFQDEHRRRTAGEPLEWLGGRYRPDEKARKDGYVDAYQGKEYGERGALEVVTMSMQAVLGEDRYSNDLLERMVRFDPDMLRLTLGVLFHYRP